jgi:drug/metabolite transporter (DMT)-like permease
MLLFSLPAVLALSASFFFGLALVLTQFGLRHVRPSEGSLVSIPFLALILWALAVFFLDFSQWNNRAAGTFLVIGLVYPAFVTLLTYEANRIMGPGAAGALGNLAPLFAVVGAAVAFADLPRPLQAIGILTIAAGAIVLTLRRIDSRTWPYWAVFLPIGASAIRGAAQPIIKSGLAIWPSPFAALLLGFTASTFVVAVVSAARHRGFPHSLPRKGLLWFCCVGASNGVAVLCLYAALTHGSIILVAPLAATYPLVTLGLSGLLLSSERITPRLMAGTAMTVGGVALLLGS